MKEREQKQKILEEANYQNAAIANHLRQDGVSPLLQGIDIANVLPSQAGELTDEQLRNI